MALDKSKALNPQQLVRLIEKTKPFAQEKGYWSEFHLFTILTLVGGLTWLAAMSSLPLPARVFASVVSAFCHVRTFILYHDYLHGAVLRSARWAKPLMSLIGCFYLRPPEDWRSSHDFHHAHNAQLKTANIGSFPLWTLKQYEAASKKAKFGYRVVRHPLVLFFGYFTCFLLESMKKIIFANPTMKLQAVCALSLHILLIYAFAQLGLTTLILAYALPYFLSCMIGVYLFYVQHNFEGAEFMPDDEWNYGFAALHSSSYFRSGPLLSFFSGNIGYHHVHHLNPKIPFYRLPEAMKAIPELQNPVVFELNWKSFWQSLRLKLWDTDNNRLCDYPAQ